MCRTLLPLTLTVLLVASNALAAAPRRAGETDTASAIFRSRAAVAKKLGAGVAEQIPQDFNFSLFALVWIDLPVDDDAVVRVVTLDADRPHALIYSSSLFGMLIRQTKELTANLISDMPCSGGVQKPPEDYRRCREGVAQNAATARKTLQLFATPRHHLVRATAISRQAPPRP